VAGRCVGGSRSAGTRWPTSLCAPVAGLRPVHIPAALLLRQRAVRACLREWLCAASSGLAVVITRLLRTDLHVRAPKDVLTLRLVHGVVFVRRNISHLRCLVRYCARGFALSLFSAGRNLCLRFARSSWAICCVARAAGSVVLYQTDRADRSARPFRRSRPHPPRIGAIPISAGLRPPHDGIILHRERNDRWMV
jgi:hypothetical protein